MTHLMKCYVVLMVLILSLSVNNVANAQDEDRIIEALPQHIQDRITAYENSLLLVERRDPDSTFDLVTSRRRWQRGATLTVAFRGGDASLRREIAAVAAEWSRHCNIKFNFGAGSAFREWSPSDTSYKANIRISFDGEGCWSLVGTECKNPQKSPPSEASMNFEGFDDPSSRPRNWKAIVLHEFGHALGLYHEHQHPDGTCTNSFRWDDDPNYERTVRGSQLGEDAQGRRPGIFTVLKAPPYEWEHSKIVRNLGQLPPGLAYYNGSFDRNSIMKYFWPAWMFKEGTASPCYSERNDKLSDKDKERIKQMYSFDDDPQSLITDRALRLERNVLSSVLLRPDLSIEVREGLQSRLEVLPTR